MDEAEIDALLASLGLVVPDMAADGEDWESSDALPDDLGLYEG